MAKYTVVGWRPITQSAQLEIEAESPEAALAEANKRWFGEGDFENCDETGDPDEIRVTNDDTGQDELCAIGPELAVQLAAPDLLAAAERILIDAAATSFPDLRAAVEKAKRTTI